MKFGDRVKETTETTGSGPLTLSGAMPRFQSFLSEIGEGVECVYTIISPNLENGWEISKGVLSGNILSRTLIKSGTGSLLNLPTGTHYVSQVLDSITANLALTSVQPNDPASTISFDNTIAEIPAVNVQEALDDLGVKVLTTAADRVQTGLDAAATAADRVQTGLDVEATAADRNIVENEVSALIAYLSDDATSVEVAAGPTTIVSEGVSPYAYVELEFPV